MKYAKQEWAYFVRTLLLLLIFKADPVLMVENLWPCPRLYCHFMNAVVMLVMMSAFHCPIGWRKLVEAILTYFSLIEREDATLNVSLGELIKKGT